MSPDHADKLCHGMPHCQCLSSREVILLATELEKTGHAIYRHAEKLAPTKKTEEIFHRMAQDELDHIRVLNKEIAPMFGSHDPSWQSDEEVAGYLKGRLDPDIFPDPDQLKKMLKKIRTEEEAVDICLDGELKAVAFYRDMLEMTESCRGDENNGAKEAIEKILAQEEEHVLKLQNLKKNL